MDPMAESMYGLSPYNSMGNSPMVYSEPEGDFIGTALTFVIDLITTAFFKGGLDPTSSTARQNAWRNFDPTASWSKTNKAFEIDKGIFTGDLGQVLLKLTWALPQTIVGNLIAHGYNLSGKVNEVNHFRGATVIDAGIDGGAVTVGNYIMGPDGFRPDFRDHLFVHEYGHYRQSNIMGPAYLPIVGIPSFLSAGLTRVHNVRWYEAWASRLGGNYFDKHFGRGAAGYFLNSPNHFDLNSFTNQGTFSPYVNPRNGGLNGLGHPINGQFHWTDIPFHILGIGFFAWPLFL